MSGIRNFLGVPSLLSASPLATLNLSVEVDKQETFPRAIQHGWTLTEF